MTRAPGPTRRALDALRQNLRAVDLVIEVCDARAPVASRAPILERLARGKRRVLCLARADLADPAVTRRWVEVLDDAVAVNAVTGTGVDRLLSRLEAAGGPARAMVVGMPNLGKSSLVNRIAGRRRARVGMRPGVTRGPQWIAVGDIALLDLPGVVPLDPTLPVLGALGLVPEGQYDAEAAAALVLARVTPEAVAARYGPLVVGAEDPLAAVARARGRLLPGGRVDRGQGVEAVLQDFRAGRLGRVSFEAPR